MASKRRKPWKSASRLIRKDPRKERKDRRPESRKSGNGDKPCDRRFHGFPATQRLRLLGSRRPSATSAIKIFKRGWHCPESSARGARASLRAASSGSLAQLRTQQRTPRMWWL
eukprot:s6400_g5.t1